MNTIHSKPLIITYVPSKYSTVFKLKLCLATHENLPDLHY